MLEYILTFKQVGAVYAVQCETYSGFTTTALHRKSFERHGEITVCTLHTHICVCLPLPNLHKHTYLCVSACMSTFGVCVLLELTQ